MSEQTNRLGRIIIKVWQCEWAESILCLRVWLADGILTKAAVPPFMTFPAMATTALLMAILPGRVQLTANSAPAWISMGTGIMLNVPAQHQV